MHPELMVWPQWGCARQEEGSCQHWGAPAAAGQGVAGQPPQHIAKPPFPHL